MSADDDPSLTEFVSGMYGDLRFEWDAAKSARNVRLRGLPFDLAPALFKNPIAITEDKRRDYGEARFQLVGAIDGIVLFCVYTMRGPGTCRIISLRTAKRKERNGYRATPDV